MKRAKKVEWSEEIATRYRGVFAGLSDYLVENLGAVRLLLQDANRETFSYYRIRGLRPFLKGEYYLDGSNHIANVADRDGEQHWFELILERDA